MDLGYNDRFGSSRWDDDPRGLRLVARSAHHARFMYQSRHTRATLPIILQEKTWPNGQDHAIYKQRQLALCSPATRPRMAPTRPQKDAA